MQPLTLEGGIVRLVPLSHEHVKGLTAVGLEPELWQLTVTSIRSENDMAAYVQAALELQANGTALPFVTVLREDRRIIGSTRFGNYDEANKRVEIGWTWLNPRFQRTGANVEAKLLMLTHAFEVLELNRVEFKTDALNEKSRNALLGIGAQEEGTLRSHMVLWTGRLRDSVYFSILKDEWPRVKARLQERLARHAQEG